MKDKKHIDRIFQEKFKNFEVAPNEAVWDRINETLGNKKKKRRIIPIWWQLGGVAAGIVLLLSLGISLFDSNSGLDSQDSPIVNTDKNNNKDSGNSDDKSNSISIDGQNGTNDNFKNEGVAESNTEDGSDNIEIKESVSNQLTNPNKTPSRQANPIVNQSLKNKESISKNNEALTSSSKEDKSKVAVNSNSSNPNTNNSESTKLIKADAMKSELEKNIKNNNGAVTENSSSNNDSSNDSNSINNIEDSRKNVTESLIENIKEKQSIEEAIAENTNTIIEKEEEKPNRWSIAPNVAPVYFSSLGEGSSIDQQFNTNSKRSDINMSYGISGSYAISEKIKIRTGVNHVNLSHTTSDVLSFTGPSSTARGVNAQYNNINFKDGIQTISIMSNSTINRSSVPEVFNTQNTGNIDQRFGFIEVPLEIEYRLLNKKFGVNVIGGFSTFFLNNNEIFADVNGSSTLIGEANNINSTSFSANFGLGMDYNLSKQWNINLEPTFKYQLNTFNNTSGDFRPFFIGVYTGLSFKF
ncbi:porin family protein [Winogradskyella ursingii]|uniref:hypothetical protein n=1 Tax=Winogradskyella ursingii TaxID=2686079 RepID=UPI0015CA50F0|nr:hypothetical protein [Winogradskyella ursingii]